MEIGREKATTFRRGKSKNKYAREINRQQHSESTTTTQCLWRLVNFIKKSLVGFGLKELGVGSSGTNSNQEFLNLKSSVFRLPQSYKQAILLFYCHVPRSG
jgi:hypothetical protein